jgi:predicted RNase H-like HicB family nuclease
MSAHHRSYNFWFLIQRAPDVPGEWTAHCLELDVVSQGSSLQQALDMVTEACLMVIGDDLAAARDPLSRRAPDRFWEEMYRLVRQSRRVDDPSRLDEGEVNFLVAQTTCVVTAMPVGQLKPAPPVSRKRRPRVPLALGAVNRHAGVFRLAVTADARAPLQPASRWKRWGSRSSNPAEGHIERPAVTARSIRSQRTTPTRPRLPTSTSVASAAASVSTKTHFASCCRTRLLAERPPRFTPRRRPRAVAVAGVVLAGVVQVAGLAGDGRDARARRVAGGAVGMVLPGEPTSVA